MLATGDLTANANDGTRIHMGITRADNDCIVS